ncbi:receptor-like protein EIX2 [Abrus precatorius]|uniref:Receptor-like protein EIX2 n=1 Tax=Abrus precatorius TaxID=3816 RepID=A0A8B8LR77_ABRPR|nr:receptor-like protein EIX2 [Abrus precatorius]
MITMLSSNLSLFSLVIFLCICFYVGSSHANKCAETDRQALLKLKDGFIDEFNSLDSWKGEDCCEWDGISCDNLTASVTELYLRDCSLRGKMDSSICELKHLTFFDLSGNEIEEVIPKCIGSLAQLIVLNLAGNNLVGGIPPTLGNLSNLQTLDLSHNHLNGTLPSTIWQLSTLRMLVLYSNNLTGVDIIREGHLSNLSELDIADNQLSGSQQLFEISKLASLEKLYLSDNQLNGTLPATVWQLSSLRTLDLSSNEFNDVDVIRDVHLSNLSELFIADNQLSGSQLLLEISKIASLETLDLSRNQLNGVVNESYLSNLSQLRYLNIAGNALTFNFNSNWVPPFQLYSFSAASCILGPKFPTWLRNQIELGNLDISNSGISDSFPNWFGNLSSGISHLNVSHNKISGALPLSLPRKKQTYHNVWDLSFNDLSGPLPPFPELDALFLSNNRFSGSITSFCATSSEALIVLDLSSNLLAGTLPDCWGRFQFLGHLNLAQNNLSGRIPKSFATLQNIGSINLNSNNFSGSLPAWIGHNLSQLNVLSLEANKFNGSIPTSLCNLLSLRVLDLSNNNITGKIPQCLSRIIVLSNTSFSGPTLVYGVLPDGPDNSRFIDKAMLEWKGQNREFKENLKHMTIIDLSCNQLTGEIPKSITTLAALAVLNLSRNNLTGFIPDNIGHMQWLESLDLSRNHLYGRMPASFSNLTFLSYMDLSFNNLSGKIPQSTQLQTFDASVYKGNTGLCGPPLPNHCPGDAVSPNGSVDTNNVEEDGDENELITIGFYVTLGFGFFVGFWGVCGTLIIKSSWRHAYFQFFNNMNDWIYVTLVVFMARMKRRFQVQD